MLRPDLGNPAGKLNYPTLLPIGASGDVTRARKLASQIAFGISDRRAQNPLWDRRQRQCVATVVEQLKRA